MSNEPCLLVPERMELHSIGELDSPVLSFNDCDRLVAELLFLCPLSNIACLTFLLVWSGLLSRAMIEWGHISACNNSSCQITKHTASRHTTGMVLRSAVHIQTQFNTGNGQRGGYVKKN